MAPSVSELLNAPVEIFQKVAPSASKAKTLEKEREAGASYPFYLPTFDLNEKFPPIEIFDHVEAGTRANPAKPTFINDNVTLNHLSPYLGTEVTGVELSELTKEGLDELALFAAERKVLLFRDQKFKDIGADRQIEIAKHFGPIHRHPTSGNVKGYPEFHVVYRSENHDPFSEYRGGNRTNYTGWHSDVSYEKQPPGTTFFFILDQPEIGGDTIFLSQVEAYNRLSDEFKKRLEGLRAVHSAGPQAEYSRQRGGPVRREPIETEHPLVRVHPATGEKALYVNQNFTQRIAGFKKEESDYLLNFLYDHLAKGSDFQIRASYKPGTVVVWDNRVTCHSATPDFSPKFRRHAVRLTPQAEVPVEAKA
ncbi:hypothetical protein BDQ12DRAFT_666566 [Crucibulum laeve]|uniref:TauD/TfdA-like domain-containing protein n=1 Tax=Crucibulum laeve TaxID=68775 RepID=A0A5C3M1G1_9AGAR|nr:hypothetical protein BDQ12DRAFT_666566 [Crucibulum laeve]